MAIFKYLINANRNNQTHPKISTTEKKKVVAKKLFVSFSNDTNKFAFSWLSQYSDSNNEWHISLYLSTKTAYVTMRVFWLLAVHVCDRVCVTTCVQGLPDALIVE